MFGVAMQYQYAKISATATPRALSIKRLPNDKPYLVCWNNLLGDIIYN